jgi:hypothetical protein
MNPKTRSMAARLQALFNCNTHGRFCLFCVLLAGIALAHGFHVARELGTNMKALSESTTNILDRVNSLEKYSVKQSSEPATGIPTLAPPLKQDSQSIILPNIPTANPPAQQYKYYAPINEKIIGSGSAVAPRLSETPITDQPVTSTDDPEADPS